VTGIIFIVKPVENVIALRTSGVVLKECQFIFVDRWLKFSAIVISDERIVISELASP